MGGGCRKLNWFDCFSSSFVIILFVLYLTAAPAASWRTQETSDGHSQSMTSIVQIVKKSFLPSSSLPLCRQTKERSQDQLTHKHARAQNREQEHNSTGRSNSTWKSRAKEWPSPENKKWSPPPPPPPPRVALFRLLRSKSKRRLVAKRSETSYRTKLSSPTWNAMQSTTRALSFEMSTSSQNDLNFLPVTP